MAMMDQYQKKYHMQGMNIHWPAMISYFDVHHMTQGTVYPSYRVNNSRLHVV